MRSSHRRFVGLAVAACALTGVSAAALASSPGTPTPGPVEQPTTAIAQIADPASTSAIVDGIGAPRRVTAQKDCLPDKGGFPGRSGSGGGSRAGGDTCATATPITTLPFGDMGNTCASADDYDEVCPYNAPGSPDVVYSYSPATDECIDITLCNGSAYDTKLYVYEDSCGSYQSGFFVACNDDSCPGYVSELLCVQLFAGHTYYIVVDGYGGDCGYYTIDIAKHTPCTAPNDDCGSVTPVMLSAGVPLVFNGDNACATSDCPLLGSPETWHAFTTSEMLDVVVDYCDTAGTWGNYYIVLAEGCPCSDFVYYSDYTSAMCANGNLTIYYDRLPAGTYYLPVLRDPVYGSQGPYTVNVIGTAPCSVACPSGSDVEGEPCGDDTNGGCNMGTPAFEPIACGTTVCGTIWADGGSRDTDWYQIVTTEDLVLEMEVEAEFPVVIGLASTIPCGSGDCDDLGGSLNPYATGGACDVIGLTMDCLPPGTYWLFVSHHDYYDWPCDDYNDYYLSLTCAPCTAPRGACCNGDGTCELLAECECMGVYAGDGTTCDPNPCPPNHDSCEDATAIGEVTDLPFDTTLAMFDGAGTCMASPNIWYCYTPACTGIATVSLCGSSYDTKLAVYDGCECDPLGTELGCEDDNCGVQSELQLAVFPGQEYLIEVGGYSIDAGPGILNVSCDAASGTLVVEADDCQDDVLPDPEAGYQVVVELWMRNLTHDATGFQAFLSFDDTVLDYRGDLSSYSAEPFSEHVTPIIAALAGAGQLDLDGSVDDLHLDGTSDDKLLATLVFDVLQECDTTLVDFRTYEIFVSELSYRGYLIDTNLVGTPIIRLDDTPPVIDVCPADPTVVECDGAGNAAELDAWLASFAAHDDCSGVTLTDDFASLSDDCGATGSATVTFTATDECGNQTSCQSTFTIQDTVPPDITTVAQ